MKKFLFGALLIVSSLMFSIKTPVYAESTTNKTSTEVLTFFEGQNQHNIGNISSFAINNDLIYYVNDNGINCFNTTTKTTKPLPGTYQNITNLKHTKSYVTFLADGKLRFLRDNTEILFFYEDGHIECDAFNVFETTTGNVTDLYISYIKGTQLHFVKIQITNTNNELESFVTYPIHTSCDISGKNVIGLCLNDSYTYLLVANGLNYDILKVKNSTIHGNVEITPLDFSYTYPPTACTSFELFSNGENNYFLLNETNHIFDVLKEIENRVEPVEHLITDRISGESFKLGEFSEITDIKYYNNKIYVADSINKNIQGFTFENNELNPAEVLIASNCLENGYFKGVNDFDVVDENTLLISDTEHNRIQKITNENITVLDKYSATNLQSPKFYQSSNKQIYYYFFDNKLIKENGNNVVEINIGTNIADLKVDAYSNVYYLNYNDNKLYIINSNTNIPQVVIENLTLTANSKLEILNDAIIISNGNTLKLYELTGEEVCTLPLTGNLTDFTSDYYGNLYCITNLGITKVVNNNHILEESSTINYNTTNLTLIRLNKVTGELIAYNNENCNFIKITRENFVNDLSSFTQICNPFELQPQETILKSGIVLNDTFISNYPYNTGLGDYLNQEEKVFVLDEIENSYYIMYNKENKLAYGYINKNYLSVNEPLIGLQTKYIVINKNIKLYKMPTILKDGNNSFVYDSVPLDTILTVVNLNLVSIDNSEYFAIKTKNNKILYVNSCDVTLATATDITSLPDLNAEILATDGEMVNLYLEDSEKSIIIMKLNNNQKVYVENYDISKEFTLVTVITEEKQEVKGFVLTKNLKLIDNNPNLTSAYILLAVAVLIAFASIIVYAKYKSSNENE